jgi:KRAB domain-containing zinc finger protein
MTTHSGNKPYKCKLCPESFINKVVLDHHMRFHGVTIKTFQCNFCSKQLCSETSLKNHIQRLHKSISQCELCKQEFQNRDLLRQHLQEEHKPSVCQVCDKSFVLPRYLKMHEKLHFEGDLPRIQCSVCSKVLGIKSIRAHVFRQHQDQFDAWKRANPTI